MCFIADSSVLARLAATLIIASFPVISHAENACSSKGGVSFNWPIPSKAKVHHTMEQKGSTLEFTFMMSLERSGDKIIVRFDDVTGESLNGQRDLGPALQMAAVTQLPSAIVIDNAGAFVRIDDYQKWANGIASTLAEHASDQFDPDKLRDLYASKQMEELLTERIAGIWSGWSSNWMGIALPLQDPVESNETMMLPFLAVEVPVKQKLSLTDEGQSTLSFELETSGEVAVDSDALEATIGNGVASMGGKVRPSNDRIEAVSIQGSVTADLICDTFQPLAVSSSQSFALSGKFESDSTQVSVGSYKTRFDWR